MLEVAENIEYTTSYPSRTRWTDMHQWIRYCRSISNIIVRLLEEAKSQAQPKRGSCERSPQCVWLHYHLSIVVPSSCMIIPAPLFMHALLMHAPSVFVLS